jgi:hypothetical protein
MLSIRAEVYRLKRFARTTIALHRGEAANIRGNTAFGNTVATHRFHICVNIVHLHVAGINAIGGIEPLKEGQRQHRRGSSNGVTPLWWTIRG